MNDAHREPIDPELMAAIQLQLSGQSETAREQLTLIWQRLAPDDLFHRCVLAHYLADLQETAAEELAWDLVALRAAQEARPETFDGRIVDVTWQSFLPSLYLNVAASHERMGHLEEAQGYAERAREHLGALDKSPLAELTSGAVERLLERLTAAPTPTSPVVKL